MEQNPSDRSLQEAARWHARLHAPDCSAQDREAFERWREANPSHAVAYARAEQTSQAADELLLADPRLRALLNEALAAPHGSTSAPSNLRRWKIPAALVATFLLCAFLALHFVDDGLRAGEPTHSFATTSTPQTILLPDGSTARLDVGTRLTVRMTPQRRFITLESGRAMFEVAHDAARPFAVTAATSRTTALGTKFQVQMDGQHVLVTLTEGSVAVDNEDSTRVWQERLRPGEQLAINVASSARDKKLVDASVVTSWTRADFCSETHA